jgi:hypothetical protein
MYGRFGVAYSVEEYRIGNPSSPDARIAKDSGVVWVLHAFPGTWQVGLRVLGY